MSNFEEENPFKGGPPPSNADLIEDYNPFQDPPPSNQQPQPPNIHSNAPQNNQNLPQITTEELRQRQEELERKARELERREEELARNNNYNVRLNNWPPFLPISFCPIKPCFYQDINIEIPVEFQRIVRYLYYVWLLHNMLLMVNMLIFLLRLFFVGNVVEGNLEGLLLSIFYFVVFLPASFVCWFRPAYKAFRNDSSFNFMVFFFVFFFQFVLSVFLALGFMAGANGLIPGVTILTHNTSDKWSLGNLFVGILVVIVAVAFVVCCILDFYLLMKVHGIYRSTGASFNKARSEFASNVLGNEHVQSASRNFAQDALRQQFGGGNNSNNLSQSNSNNSNFRF